MAWLDVGFLAAAFCAGAFPFRFGFTPFYGLPYASMLLLLGLFVSGISFLLYWLFHLFLGDNFSVIDFLSFKEMQDAYMAEILFALAIGILFSGLVMLFRLTFKQNRDHKR